MVKTNMYIQMSLYIHIFMFIFIFVLTFTCMYVDLDPFYLDLLVTWVASLCSLTVCFNSCFFDTHTWNVKQGH